MNGTLFTADGHQPLLGLGVAALIGLVIGIERQWSGHASGPQARFAGVRTFFMLGLIGGLSGLFVRQGWTALAVVLLAAGAALILVAYVSATRRPGADTDATTEVAALLVLALGVLAVQGHLALASGIGALAVLALREKVALHNLVQRIGEEELRAAFQFAVMALVVLPLLPQGPFGPLGGVRPRALWAAVLLFSALSFAGYIARRIAGPRLGYPIAGLLGGLVSSTAATLHFSRLSRREPNLSTPLAVGVLAACTVLLPRVAIVSAILNPAVATALLPYLLPAAVVGVGVVAGGFVRRHPPQSETKYEEKSPLRLTVAMQMALALQATLLAMTFVRQTWGSTGVLASAAVLGLTDVDALVLSMTALGRSPDVAALGAKAIAVGILSNTALKLTLVLVLGGARFRLRAASGLLALVAATAVGLWWNG
jgi:uncharacterized membrane protein (DUF4010 family)